MSHPYKQLPQAAFWRTAVADKRPREIWNLWEPKFPITKSDRIATFGSCFAQHIGRALVAHNYNWFDAELPEGELDRQASRDRGYGIFSARTGNIYTAAALRQWIDWAAEGKSAPEEVWESDGRYFDPFRPTVEPSGFSSPAELLASRDATLRALRDVAARASLFVFTFGLTEAWVHRDGYTYAICPGTGPGGEFDPSRHSFKNFTYQEIADDMLAVVATLRRLNENIRVLLTVSPVPLTATASGKHVLVATTQSKAVLRAVAGHLSTIDPAVDYFPSYEIITGAPFRSRFFEPNLRSVTPEGVDFVMRHFFGALNHGPPRPEATMKQGPATRPRLQAREVNARRRRQSEDDVVCEEILLDAFAPDPAGEAKKAVDPDAAKICIIGNSHVGALRKALRDEIFVDPKLDFVFWAFPGESYNDLKFEGGEITHPDRDRALRVTDGRFASLNPNHFDAIVFVGAGFNPGDTLIKLRERTQRARADFGIVNGTLFKISSQVLSKRPSIKVMKRVARAFPGKTLYVASPLISELSDKFKEQFVSQRDLNRFNKAVAKMFARHGITYVAQPPDTIRDNKWTRAEFSREDNFRHMNAQYGGLILTAIRNCLREGTA